MKEQKPTGLKCIHCGVLLSSVVDNFKVAVADYLLNQPNHVCDPKDVALHKQKESEAIKSMVKEVRIKQTEILKNKEIINPEILNIPMDAPSKLPAGVRCRCPYFDGTCHNCGNKEQKQVTAEELTLTQCMDKVALIEIRAISPNHNWKDWADWHRYLHPTTAQSFRAFRSAAEMYAGQFQGRIAELEAERDRYREALNEIIKQADGTGLPEASWHRNEYIGIIAKEALNQKEK